MRDRDALFDLPNQPEKMSAVVAADSVTTEATAAELATSKPLARQLVFVESEQMLVVGTQDGWRPMPLLAPLRDFRKTVAKFTLTKGAQTLTSLAANVDNAADADDDDADDDDDEEDDDDDDESDDEDKDEDDDDDEDESNDVGGGSNDEAADDEDDDDDDDEDNNIVSKKRARVHIAHRPEVARQTAAIKLSARSGVAQYAASSDEQLLDNSVRATYEPVADRAPLGQVARTMKVIIFMCVREALRQLRAVH